MTVDIKPPAHDLDREAIALAAILFGSVDADTVLEQLNPETFFAEQHGTIFQAAKAVREAGATPNPPTVAAWLRSKSRLESVGGAAYLKELELQTSYFGNLAETCRTLRELAALRKLVSVCQGIVYESASDVGDIRAWLDEAESRIRNVTAAGVEDGSVENAFDIMARVFRSIQSGEAQGIDTGLVDLDRILGGMRPQQLITIGAHSGIGKSALAAGIAVNVALKHRDRSVLFFSLEMSREELVQRMLFSEARVNSTKLNNKKWMTDNDWNDVAAAASTVGLRNFWADDRAGLTIGQIRARARRRAVELKRAGSPLALVVVDYAQLAAASTQKNKNREQEVAEVSRGLKHLAKELELPVIVLAQLNEDSRKDKRKPSARDLRESRSLHHDSDKVVLIYNEHADKRAEARFKGDEVPTASPNGESVILIVDKNRGGSTGSVDAMFFPTFTLFANEAGA